MKPRKSRETAELNADHRQMHPRFCARLSLFVVSHESTVAHEPSKGSLDDPSLGQNSKALNVVRALDHFDLDLGPALLHPILEVLSCITAIDPNLLQLGVPSSDPVEQLLRSVPFRATGRRYQHSQQQTQGINQDVTLSSLDSFAGVVADIAAMAVGFDALTVQDGRGRLLMPLLNNAKADSQCIVEGRPSLIHAPEAKDMVNRLPRGEVGGHLTPGDAALENIEDGIDDPASVGRRSATFFEFRQHGLKKFPLRVGQIGIVGSIFHRPNGGCADN